ncbi:TetR/AcrR family transcriptional regulator [Pseudonocardia endophytica]|uniref:TetR family transcriptional regulator n=1 Tax=Pseudonocardia endophytica TaxID=401976 RepID=A0A4R1HP59_PSEEN|nr:TetR/AcrR family transcriptional regulator [Pseudonocardia endophytica]TCK21509.1 TetR family transcriptional regulator [Pseudonocardia endophytica]
MAGQGAGAADDRPAPRRGRRPMSDRRRALQRLEISREAIRLFGEQGVTRTSGEQIAEACGLSARTLWRYFRTKESCVEPVLSLSTDAFLACLARWPEDRSLDEHLVADYRLSEDGQPTDGELVLAVVRLSREEPALRAIWLVVNERAEPVLAEIIAGRLGRSADDVETRVQAAALNAALRIATEDIAASVAARPGPRLVDDMLAHLSAAVRAATRGVVGDALDGG